MKYIVYCTTNLINKKIYVGQHLTKDPNKFDGYIGCGVYINKPSTYNKPKTHFQYAVQKYGIKNFKRVVIKSFDNLEDALELEALIVDKDFLARKDVYNEILGGSDSVPSVNCYQYDLDGNFIAEYASQQKAALAVGRGFTVIKRAIKYKIKSANSYWSLEKVNKLDLSEYKTTDNKILVFQYSDTGVYDCCYESVSDAARVNQATSSNISRACKLGYKCHNKYFSYYFTDSFDKAKNESLKNCKIYQYDLNGNFIAEFNSYIEAQKSIGKCGLQNAIKLGRIFEGYQWKLEKLESIAPVVNKSKARKVGQYTLDGTLVKVYNTVSECTKKFSGCRNVLHGRNKTSGGYIFKYIE